MRSSKAKEKRERQHHSYQARNFGTEAKKTCRGVQDKTVPVNLSYRSG